jgi:ERCC4-type nuclease
MFAAPTEPPALKALANTVSMLPERYGVDYLWPAQGKFVGVQRKEVTDLLASVQDGRLARELAQMQNLLFRWLVIEGPVRFTSEGVLIAGTGFGQQWTREQWEGLIASVQLRGCWITSSANVGDTGRVLGILKRWSMKPRHASMHTRSGPVSLFGKPDNRDWQIHLLQGFEGIGYELAGRILDHFGGIPLQWTVSAGELKEIVGLGPKKIATMMGAFSNGG